MSRSVTLGQGNEVEALATEIRRTLVASLPGLGQIPMGTAPPGAGGAPLPTSHFQALTLWLSGEGADGPFARELAAALGPEAHAPGDEPASLASHATASTRSVRVAPLPPVALAGVEALPPSFDRALGLALMGLRPTAERIDLGRQVQTTSEAAAPGPARRLPLIVGAGAVAVAAAFLLLGPGAGDPGLAAAAARAQAEARQIATRRTEVEGRVRQLAVAVAPPHSYLDVLNEVSRLSGPDAWLTQFAYDRGRPLVIHGAALSNEAVGRLVDGLRASPHLEQVALGSVTRAETKEIAFVQFTITGTLRGDAPLETKRARRSRTPRSGA
jgi:Tfp pilus assembly protein PilN